MPGTRLAGFVLQRHVVGIRDADLSVLGVDVSLDARVRWRWDWSDGAPQWTVFLVGEL